MRFSLLRAVSLALGVVTALPAAVAPVPDENVLVIRPTVTVATGDTGGTFQGQKPPADKTRHYYIAAESELWDFVPAGRDVVCGLPLPLPVLRNRTGSKIRYIQYTDATFTAKVLPNPSLGIMGPALRGVVGEYLAITFFNRSEQPLSIHPHGVKYDKDSEGAYYLPGPGHGAAVAPGAKFTYVWQLDESSGPRPDEPSSKAWLYHSHVSGDTEINLGLVGCIIVTDAKRARPDGTPRDVDREFATLFMIFDESGLDQAAIEAAEYAGLPGLMSEAPPPTWAEVQQQRAQNSRYAINGYIFGNLHGLEMNQGERVRWYLFGLGSEQDLHTPHWHGLRVVEEGRRNTDVIELLPASMKVADMVPDNPGSWLFHCHVSEHMREGMFARVDIYGPDRVGADRAPAAAFLGYPSAAQSIRLDRAEALLNLTAKPARAELIVEGVVTVFEAFAAFNQPVRIKIGDRTIEFHPDAQGVAKEPRAMLRIKNVNEFGVVHGGVLEFVLTLNGADWLPDINAQATAKAAPTVDVPLVFELGHGRHAVTAHVTRRSQ